MLRNCTAKRLWVFGALALLGVGLAMGSQASFGFTLLGPTGDMEDAVRWSNVPGSLVENGVRGLGGGIEYAIADDFCDQLIPRFLDDPKPTCEQVKAVIKEAFDNWAAGHPVLRFTDVTGKIKPARPPAGRDPSSGFGAEIDFFAVLEPFTPGRAYAATFYRRNVSPIGTNGKELPGHTITSADIVFKPGSECYYIDPALEGRRLPLGPGISLSCSHFLTITMHEIGHALGLDHPHQHPDRNFDTDDDPTNPIPIDCEDPTKGLKRSRNVNTQAVMSYGPPEVRALTNDDIGGRNFLYPICPSASAGAVSAGWARGQTRPISGD